MVLRVSRISKEFSGKSIYKDVSFEIASGECFALVGPNGAGKTSILRSILGIYEVSEGDISINGVSVRTAEYSKELKKIAVVLDNLGLYRSLNAWDNIEFFDRLYYVKSNARDRNKRISEALKFLDLYEHKDSNITFFSKGMKQRLALARAFIQKPELIILDEPFQGLDIDGSLLLRNYILEMKKKGISTIISSHDLLILGKLCDHFLFINHGRVVGKFSLDEIKESLNNNFYEIATVDASDYTVCKTEGEVSIVYSASDNLNNKAKKLTSKEVDIEMLYKALNESVSV